MKSALTRISAIITDLALFTPINLLEEKKKFLSNTNYDPQFNYKKTDFNILSFRKNLKEYLQESQDPDERISTLIQERVRELLLWLSLQETKGSEEFTSVSLRLYGKPSLRLLGEAKKLLEEIPFENPGKRPLTGKDIKGTFEEALKKEGLYWPVILKDDLLARMHIIKGKELRISSTARFSEKDVEKLIVHEIQTHARRFKNGQMQDYDIFETGTAHFLETEEGLATYNEDKAGLLPNRVKRNLAARVLAVNKALVSSFSEVYNYMLPYVGKDKAFELALNVKRGLSDTSKPGGFTKAYIYFAGWQKIKLFSKKDLQYLYIGKVSYIHLPLIKELVKEKKVRIIL